MTRFHYRIPAINNSMQFAWFMALCVVFATWKAIGTGSVVIQIVCLGLSGIIGVRFLMSSNKSLTAVYIFSILAFALPMDYGFAKYLFIMSFVILAMRKIESNEFHKLVLRLAIIVLLLYIQKYRIANLFDESLFNTGLLAVFFIGLGFLCFDRKGMTSCLYMFSVIGAIVSLLNYYLPMGTYGIQTGYNIQRFIAAAVDPNYYAGVYILPLTASLLLLQSATTLGKRVLWLGLCLIILLGIMGTGSRGACMFALLILVLFVLHHMRRSGVAIKIRVITYLCVMAILTLTSIYNTPLHTRYDQMDIIDIFASEYGIGGRISIWDNYIYDIIPNNIMFGQGFDWPIHFNVRGEHVQTAAHNTYIQVLADNGIIGTIILLLCLWPCIRAYWFLLRQYLSIKELFSGDAFLFLSYTGFLVTNCFLTGYPDKLLFLSSGLMLHLGSVICPKIKLRTQMNTINRTPINAISGR